MSIKKKYLFIVFIIFLKNLKYFSTTIFSVFPSMPTLETLSISYMSPLSIIGRGALSGLTGLKTLMCSNNVHLTVFHASAISSHGEDNTTSNEVWPPIKSVNFQRNR